MSCRCRCIAVHQMIFIAAAVHGFQSCVNKESGGLVLVAHRSHLFSQGIQSSLAFLKLKLTSRAPGVSKFRNAQTFKQESNTFGFSVALTLACAQNPKSTSAVWVGVTSLALLLYQLCSSFWGEAKRKSSCAVGIGIALCTCALVPTNIYSTDSASKSYIENERIFIFTSETFNLSSIFVYSTTIPFFRHRLGNEVNWKFG